MVRIACIDRDEEQNLRRVFATAKGTYLVIDFYEGISEVLYDGNNLRDAKRAKRERLVDTDGEAYVKLYVREG